MERFGPESATGEQPENAIFRRFEFANHLVLNDLVKFLIAVP
jgi:hypothetical protein